MDVNQIIQGDALSVLKGLPDGIVQTCCTSPPYYGLRDYQTATWEGGNLECVHRVGNQVQDNKAPGAIQAGVRPGVDASRCKLCGATRIDQQIGLEETPEAYVAKLVEVFREVRRVLRDDGTLWLNLGDSYASGGKSGEGEVRTVSSKLHASPDNPSLIAQRRVPIPPGLKPKDLIGIPWMVAFALRTDGWYLRSDCIWNKPNCMPESVEDRPTKSHEYLFLLSKNERYYYDADGVREPHTLTERVKGRAPNFAPHQWIPNGNSFGNHNRAGGDGVGYNPAGRNKRSVWTVASQPYSEAHFATFPPKLIEPCILAGTSPRACECCGSPWERVTEPTGHVNKREIAHVPNNTPTKIDSTGWAPTRQSTDQWQPTCTCPSEGTGKCIILDPFIGAGTTALVAIQHGRNYLGIDLNVSYVQLAEKRIATVQQNLWTSGSEAIAV